MENLSDGYSTRVLKLMVKGSTEMLSAAQKTIDLVFSSVKLTHPDLRYEWDDCGYTDDIGGHHDSGVGWSPDGKYCGECNSASCSSCKIWEWRKKKESIENGNLFRATMRAKLSKAGISLEK